MISSSKVIRIGLVVIVALGIVIVLTFRYELLDINVDRRSSESLGGDDVETEISKVRTRDPDRINSGKSLAGVKIPDELTPAKASLLFENFKSKNPGNRDRFMFASAIMKKLCELGYTQEAWDLIEKDQGDVRGNQLSAFFANAKLSNSELLGRFSRSTRSDLHVSFCGIMERFKPEQYEEFISSPDFEKFLEGLDSLDPKEAAIIKNNVSSGVGQDIAVHLYETPDRTQDILEIAARLNSEGILDTPRFMDLAARFGRSDPFENWDLISAIKSDGENRAEGLRSNMLRDMLEVDAPKAFSKILDKGNPGKALDIESAIGSWVNLDSSGAADWFQQNRATLNPQDRDAIAAAFSTYAGKLSEFSGAQQWAEQIQDPALKAEIIKKNAEVAAAKEERAHETQ